MLPEEVAVILGYTSAPRLFEVEKGAIRRFADAIDDRNPLYWDDEYAAKSKYGSIIAPPGFFGWPVTWERRATLIDDMPVYANKMMKQAGYGVSLEGGIEYDFLKSIKAGDVLSAVYKITDIVPREGKAGTMFFVTTEITYSNTSKDAEAVAKVRFTMIYRKG